MSRIANNGLIAWTIWGMAVAAHAFPAPQISQISTSITQGRHARVAVSYHVSEEAIVLCDVMTNVADDVYASIGPVLQLTFTGDVGRKVAAGDRLSLLS